MDFNLNEVFELPLVVTKGYVGYPNSQVTLSVEREISSAAVLKATSKYESYCILVSQKDVDATSVTSFDDISAVAITDNIIRVEKAKVGYRVKFSGLNRIRLSSIRQEEGTFFASATLFPDVSGDNKEEMFFFSAGTASPSMAVGAADQGSPNTSFSPFPYLASSSLRIRFIRFTSRSPIRSKRNPSM